MRRGVCIGQSDPGIGKLFSLAELCSDDRALSMEPQDTWFNYESYRICCQLVLSCDSLHEFFLMFSFLRVIHFFCPKKCVVLAARLRCSLFC